VRLRRIPLRVRRTIARLSGLLGVAALAFGARAAPVPRVDPAIAPDLRALDCANVSAASVRDVLAKSPAPRIVLLQGSVPLVTMEPFARFLIAMGYPEMRLADPRSGEFSESSFTPSEVLAGELAFDYERTAMAPMLIGHSQGGMLVIRTLYEFAGAFHDAIHVVDPASGEALARTTIVDPYTQRARSVVGLRVAYGAAIATGWLPRLMLGQWSMLSRLRTIPDSVDDFTGFILPNDPIEGNLFGDRPYEASGSAHVRTVVLPGGYHHTTLPRVAHLAADPAMRAWIDAWRRGDPMTSPEGDTSNLVHATDIWYSVKRHWCLQAQRLLALPAS
jgi:hypothetical protein